MECVTLKQCGVETHGSPNWDSPPPEEDFSGRGDIIFINPFFLRYELLPDIVAILECTKRTESSMRTFPHNNVPQNQEKKPEPHENKVLFLGTPGNQESAGQSSLRNL